MLGELGQAQGVGRRAAQHGHVVVEHHPQALVGLHATAGHGHRPDFACALVGGPEADERTEREREEDAVPWAAAGATVDLGPASAPPIPRLWGIEDTNRPLPAPPRRLLQLRL